jgi:hypothetical protein
MRTLTFLLVGESVATPLWAKCEDETHTPKSGDLESFETPKNSELDCRGQNTSHWGVLYINGKVLKCRCTKWPRMSHLDICSPSYGQTKGRKSNWQFDSWPLKVGNRPLPDICRRSAIGHWKALEESNLGQFRDFSLGVSGKSAIRMWLPWSNAENTIWGKVVASPESRPWWVKWVQGHPWLVPTPNGCRMNFNQLGVGFGCRIM